MDVGFARVRAKANATTIKKKYRRHFDVVAVEAVDSVEKLGKILNMTHRRAKIKVLFIAANQSMRLV